MSLVLCSDQFDTQGLATLLFTFNTLFVYSFHIHNGITCTGSSVNKEHIHTTSQHAEMRTFNLFVHSFHIHTGITCTCSSVNKEHIHTTNQHAEMRTYPRPFFSSVVRMVSFTSFVIVYLNSKRSPLFSMINVRTFLLLTRIDPKFMSFTGTMWYLKQRSPCGNAGQEYIAKSSIDRYILCKKAENLFNAHQQRTYHCVWGLILDIEEDRGKPPK